MKRVIHIIGLIAIILAINSCSKCEYFFAFCNKGHAPWQGNQQESCHGDLADTKKHEASLEATDHDFNVHGGSQNATVISELK